MTRLEHFNRVMSGEAVKGFEVDYLTAKGRRKWKYLETLSHVKAWCRRNTGKVTIKGASWQVFHVMDEIKIWEETENVKR